MTDIDKAHEKKRVLVEALKSLDSLLIAYSGGVDSTFLLAVAHEVLGPRVLAVTATAAFYPAHEVRGAIDFARQHGIEHLVIPSEAGTLPAFRANPPDRCYHCKSFLFRKLKEVAEAREIRHIAHGANADDSDDYRPGKKAAEKAGALAPLLDAGMSKEEIRRLSKEMELPTWNKPAMACLASRIPYGEPITEAKLKMIEEAEAFLAAKGFRQFRVRCHGSLARIEVDEDGFSLITATPLREAVASKLKELGFLYVSIDMEGYVTGSLNRDLKK
jgi:pyridinium-3,5-biscarboxylic acid mononucleotide sulfurtransferase